MLKEIGAVPNDTVVLKENSLYINGHCQSITVSSQDSRGGELFPYPTPLVISNDNFWLVSDPAQGFDSRYFGPINRSAFTHVARPIF
ncbi:hypothetical protein FACS1894187_21930 [Synergistales bacterium]|nr:hypothetical protein FACS1894187_21930 [Synergistales bacterium]